MSLKHMESDDKGDQDGACLKKYVIAKNVEISMACDMLQHSEMPSKSTGQDQKYVAIDAACGIEDISCISKDEGLNGHSGDNNKIILTGSSSSVNSFFPTEYKEQIDVQSSKHSRGNSDNFEGHCQCKSSHPCTREALRSPVDPSETSYFRDEHAVAISLKADSQRKVIDVVQNVQNYEHKNAGSIEPDDPLFAAALVGSERDEVLEDASPVKEPPKYQMLEDNEGTDELVDVPVCDICGDVGRERLLALCSNCSDGAEHTYCMRIKRDELPGDDWMCEECTGTGYSHKILVDNEGVNAVKAPPSEMGHGSGDICVDSSKVTLENRIDNTSAPSGLGKRVGPYMLANSSNKKRVLSGSLGFYAQRVVVSPRSRGIGSGATHVASSSGGNSSRNVSGRMHSPVAGSSSKGRLIKSSGLKVDPQEDGGCRTKSSAGKSVAAQMSKKHIPKKLRKCESFQISRPVYPDTSDSKDVLSDDLKYQNKAVKCKIAQRSHSFDFKNSRPVSPISPGRLSRAKTHQPASVLTEVEQSLMPRKKNLEPQSSRVHRTSEQALVPPTAEKAPPIIIRNKNVSGSKEKILNTGPAKGRRSTNPVKDSNCCSGMKRGQKTDDMEVEEGAVEEAIVQMDGTTKVLPDSFPSACTSYPAASSLNCAWRGVFRIEGVSKLPIWCKKLQAHLSSSASLTVFDMVSNWPGEIMVKEVLKRDICADQFQKCGTMGTDACVYFFAEGLESDRRMYKKFLNCMARNNLALQSNLGGAELLVFPSHYLPKKVQRLNKRFYMCGTFKVNYSSYLACNISPSSPQKGSQKPESGRQLSGHGNGSPSTVGTEVIPISIQGHESTGMKETVPNCWVKSIIPDEVEAKSTDGRSRSGDMLDCSGHKQKENHRTHVPSGVENAVHPAADRSSCSNNLGFSSIEECPVTAGFRYPQERSSSPLDTLLYAVDVIENFKTNPGSLSADSDHCGKVIERSGLEVQPSENTSAYHRDNLELSMSSTKENPENCRELDLLSGLASSKDGQIELGGGNYDGGRRRCYNVSLDLTLALP